MSLILGIETSCDESACAIVTNEAPLGQRIVFQSLYSQLKQHAAFGGVVPEIASRAHMEMTPLMIKKTLEDSGISLEQLDAIAVTQGPGLIGGLLVGVMLAKAIAYASNKPLIGVNHLEGHALAVRLEHDVPMPFLLLLVSGGHCQILLCCGVGDYLLLGKTRDDALGEAFDKVAKMLGLGYPGGPVVEKRSLLGNPKRFDFPRPMIKEASCDMSFSGLKTAIFQTIEASMAQKPSEVEKEELINDICASFQACILDVLVAKITYALKLPATQPAKHIVVSGGVAANQAIRGKLTEIAAQHQKTLIAPSLKLCTDNAAMIAWAGLEKFELGHRSPLSITPKTRWPLYG
jgi:N6-L-threonylcarbamoyladenine synthase